MRNCTSRNELRVSKSIKTSRNLLDKSYGRIKRRRYGVAQHTRWSISPAYSCSAARVQASVFGAGTGDAPRCLRVTRARIVAWRAHRPGSGTISAVAGGERDESSVLPSASLHATDATLKLSTASPRSSIACERMPCAHAVQPAPRHAWRGCSEISTAPP